MQMVSAPGMNGAVLHCMQLTRELAHRGHALTLVCPPGLWISTQLAHQPIRIIESSFQRWSLSELLKLSNLARDSRIEVFHSHSSRAHVFGQLLSWLTGIPCVATAHNQYIQLNWMFHLYVIAVSEATRRFHRRFNGVRSQRIGVVHNFLDGRPFHDVPPNARNQVRASFDILDTSPVLGTVGTLFPYKGLTYLIRGLKEIATGIPDARLLIVGDGPSRYKQKLKNEADRLGLRKQIVWAGHRIDIPQVLSAMDLFVMPSLRDSLPMAVMEAMAAGLPVVATTVGGLPECVLGGKTGLLVPPADHRALSEAVICLLSDKELCRRFGEAGRKRVQHNFSMEIILPKIEAILSRVSKTKKNGLATLPLKSS
jgi:glycosyltransferase involved in cell wall biosynthesis